MVCRCMVARCGGVASQRTWCDFHAPRQAGLSRDDAISEVIALEKAERSCELRVWAGVLGIELDEVVDTEAPIQKVRSPAS